MSGGDEDEATAAPDGDLSGVADFLYEIGYLKRVPRAGWLIAGVASPESIADHSFRTAIIGVVLAQLEGADVGRTALLCLLHDTQETRTGDIPSVERGYVTKASNEAVTEDQTAGLPGVIAQALCSLVGEYEARQSPEAQLARDADKLECLLQAREYQASGHTDVAEWIRTSAAVLRSPSARRLGDLCAKIPPSQWWAEAAAAYPQASRPRAASG